MTIFSKDITKDPWLVNIPQFLSRYSLMNGSWEWPMGKKLHLLECSTERGKING